MNNIEEINQLVHNAYGKVKEISATSNMLLNENLHPDTKHQLIKDITNKSAIQEEILKQAIN